MEEKKLTGYPSIDKPWLKYYSEQAINSPIPRMTAYEYLKKQNAARLNRIAIDSEFGCYTYGELFNEIDKTASGLYAMGIQKGAKVLSMFPVLPHESFLFYGVDAVGGVLCQIAPQYGVAEVCEHVNRIGAELFFTLDSLMDAEMERKVYSNTTVRNIIVVNCMPMQQHDQRTMTWNEFLIKGNGKGLPEENRDSSELLFLASTGGSTGEPKSVMLSADCFNIAVHQYLHSDLDYQPGDRWIRLWAIFSASAAVANHHLPLCAGMRMLLRPFPMDITIFDQMVIDNKPQHLMLIPQLLDVLETSKLLLGEDLSFIKTVGCGGLALTVQFEERVNRFMKAHQINTFIGYGWGSTECSATGSNRTNRETTIIGTAGAPMVKNIISAFDPETGEEVRYGEVGELCISSPNLMMGYYDDPELTAQVLRRHMDGSLWLHTGDLGTVREDGIIVVKGRMTRVIFVFPTAKIYPQALESAVSKVQGIQDVVFCEIPDLEHEGFFLPVCFVIPNGTCSAEEVRANVNSFCAEFFPEHARPKKTYIRSRFPLTHVGKPDIMALEKEAQNLI